MSKTTKFDLAGWAAIITAIAALITSIGFPNFFPDLIKNILGEELCPETTVLKKHNANSQSTE